MKFSPTKSAFIVIESFEYDQSMDDPIRETNAPHYAVTNNQSCCTDAIIFEVNIIQLLQAHEHLQLLGLNLTVSCFMV